MESVSGLLPGQDGSEALLTGIKLQDQGFGPVDNSVETSMRHALVKFPG